MDWTIEIKLKFQKLDQDKRVFLKRRKFSLV